MMDSCSFTSSQRQRSPLPGTDDEAVRKASAQQFSEGMSRVAVVSGSGTKLRKVLLMERFLFTGVVKRYADDVRLFNN